jgi:dihydroneopterin aldolase/2-amino-4-hydroxy-6-hydroxymethyldihydropteridine diphosphokinase
VNARPTQRATVAIGSSVPPARDRVLAGLDALDAHPLLTVIAASDVEDTLPAGGATLQRFANAACVIETALGPAALLKVLHTIEADHGRLRTRPLGPRCLDLDLLEVHGWPTQHGIRLPHPGRDAPYAAATRRQALARAAER